MKIKKITNDVRNFMNKAKPFALAFAVAYATIFSNVAFAAGGTEIFEFILKILSAFCLVSAVILGIIGAINYAEAKSDGEGPAMAKAQNKIISAVMLGVIGASLALGAPSLADFINDQMSF